MFKPLQLFVGLRYTRAKRRNHFISFISIISMLGIAVGMTALITVMSVMNGYGNEIKERILGMISHATISGLDGTISEWRPALEIADDHPEIVGAAPYILQETMLKGYRVGGAAVQGVDPELEPLVSEIPDRLIAGTLDSLESGEFNVLLGVYLAAKLGVDVGDKVTIYAPQIRATPAGVIPQVKRFTVSGIFSAGHSQYDEGLAVVHIEDAAKLFRMQNAVSGVRLKMTDMLESRRIALDLRNQLPGLFTVRDWTEQHSNLFRAVRMEKTVMFVILSLIIAVAAFNIISTLVMVVTDKQSDIAILRTLGAGPGTIMGIFIVLGSFIGFFGTALGAVGGILLASNVETIVPALERVLNTQFLAADIYYISNLPSDMEWADVIKVSLLSLALTVVATIYPAWRASRTDPAEALRYE